MGFFTRIIDYFQGINYSSKEDKLTKRITQLRKEAKDCEKKELPHKSFDYSIFDFSHKPHFFDVKVFTPKEITVTLSLVELQNRRLLQEQERLAVLSKQASQNLDAIRTAIENRNASTVEKLLPQTMVMCKELKDNRLIALFEEYSSLYKTLKEELRLEEIERQRQLELKRRELETKRIEQERIEREKRKEREAERLREIREYEERLAREEDKRRQALAQLKDRITRRKENASSFIQYLKSAGVHYFYHFTDKRNIQSIKKFGGLFSWYYCQQNNIKIPDPGGDSWSRSLDVKHGLEDYVRLSFCSDHPMAFRKHNEGCSLVLLKIKIEVAGFEDTQFSDMNAAADNVSHGKTIEALKAVNIAATKATYVSRSSPIFSEHQAECMVKTFIPIEYIQNIDYPQQMYFS